MRTTKKEFKALQTAQETSMSTTLLELLLLLLTVGLILLVLHMAYPTYL